MNESGNIFDLFAPLLNERDIRVLLIGGHAFQEYGLARQTLDVDWLSCDQYISGIKDIMKDAGFSQIAETGNFLRFHKKGAVGMDVDLLIVDDNTFEALYRESIPKKIRSTEWQLPRLLHLIMLKVHAMKNNPRRKSRDVADIVDVLNNCEEEITDEELKSVCEKYGPEEIYEFIRRLR